MEKLARFLQAAASCLCAEKGELCLDVPLSSLCTFRIGGPANAVLYPTEMPQFCRLVQLAQESAVPYRILGGGSNILPPDNGFDGIVLSTRKLRKITINGNYISAECGMPLNLMIRACTNGDLGGLCCLYGIPGTVGGAVYMNAGAHGQEISEHLCGAELLDTYKNRRFFVSKASLGFSYRYSRLQTEKQLILLRAFFRLPFEKKQVTQAAICEVCRVRRASQPLEFPSAGSVFRRPTQGEAWRFIDACGLRGKRIGGAQISEKHAGFIINRGGALAADVRALIALCEERVAAECGIQLVREIEFF